MKAQQYEDIGHYLKDIRQSQTVSLAEAAQAMHIRQRYLEAIERGDFSLLPGKAYVRGYIKNYALFLGINPAETLAAYDGISGVVKQEFFIPEPTVKENLPSRSLLFVVLGGILLFGLYYALFSKSHQVTLPKVEEVPITLQFAIESKKDPRMAEWETCLNSNATGCFHLLYAHTVLSSIQAEYRKNFTLMSQY